MIKHFTNLKTFSLLSLLLVSSLLFACQKSMSDIERSASHVPPSARVGLVPFSQPMSNAALITGSLPQSQGRVAKDVLNNLDGMMRASLYQAQRQFTDLPLPLALTTVDFHETATPSALPQWINYGREYKLDFLLVPQVLNWHQREGSRAGVTQSAHVRVEFFLLDVRTGRVFRRSVFEEKQAGLAEDLSRVGTFFKRGGGWVTAEELTQEAINKAIGELGL